MKKKTHKKPGAQPGNTNALRHGYYLSRPRPSEWHPSQPGRPDTLLPEIDALRYLIRRLDQARANPDPGLKDPLLPDQVIAIAVRRLAAAKRAEDILSLPAPDSGRLDTEIIDDIRTSNEELLTLQDLEAIRQKLPGPRLPPLSEINPFEAAKESLRKVLDTTEGDKTDGLFG